jgi:hypothetical protein
MAHPLIYCRTPRAIHNFKPLKYPDLVISGGKIVVNNFEKSLER